MHFSITKIPILQHIVLVSHYLNIREKSTWSLVIRFKRNEIVLRAVENDKTGFLLQKGDDVETMNSVFLRDQHLRDWK